MRNIISKFFLTLLALTLGFSQMWGDVTLFTADFSAAAWDGVTFSQGNTDNYDVINGITFHSKNSSKQFSISGGVLTWPNNNMSSNNYYLGFPITGINEGSITISVWDGSTATRVKYVVKNNEDTFSANIGSSGTNTNSASPTTVTVSSLGTKAFVYLGRQGSGLTTITKIVVTTPNPSCAAGDPGDITKGALSGGELTLSVTGSAASGDTWYWQTAEDGTSKTNDAASISVNAAGTYYIRSYNTAGDCWSDAKSITITSTDLVENYTVVYKDGSTTLNSEVVAVGDHPAGIADPTKDCYAFAGWLNGSTPVADVTALSGTADEEIELTATWTPIYSSSATLISDENVSAKANVNTIFAASNIVSSITFTSSNYEFTSNVTKPGYYGYKDKQSGDYMKIMLQQGKRVQVLFGNLGADPTITVNGAAQSLDASRATGDNAENTFTYTATAADALIVITMGSGTNTLKKVDINSLFSATYTDGTGDASGSASDVAEVTLPTPTETTVGGNTFTGWTANQIVKVGGVDQSIGTELTAGTVVELTANTTFTAVWVTTSDFDVRFFPGYGTNEQIGTTQSISTGNYATPEADPTREGYRFLGWSTDGTEANIEDVTAYGITAATDFTAVWVQQFEVTFNLQGYGAAIAAQKVDNGGKVSMPFDPVAADQEFGGWYKESTCDNIWDFNVDVVSTTTEIFAKWTAFTGCTMLHPALSGSALSVNDDVDLQAASNGGSIKVVGMKNATSIQYNSNGLLLGGGGADVIGVTLSSELAVGTQISVKLMAAGTGSRGLDLLTSTGATVGGGTKLGWDDATNGAVATFSYTVVAGDGLEGTNEFRLKRNNSVYLKYVKVESCGSAIIYHDLTSAVDPSGMGTVTLGASSVREGYTTTAEYSAIDAAYEFDEWQISGTGATLSDAHANPVTITMGTADAVVTLKLKVATLKHTVSFNTHGGSAIDDVQVVDGEKLAAAPADPTKEDYIFQGWSATDGGSIIDITDVTIDEDKTFHAVWAAETGVIKLIVDGATPGEKVINHTNFITGATMAGSPVEIESVNYNYALLGGTASTPYNQNQLNKFITYNATTTQTKVMVDVYNTATSARQVIIKGIVEGAEEATDIATIDLDNGANKHVKSAYYSFDNTKNRTIYISVPSSVNTVDFLQVKIVETGTPLPMFGEAGYSINLNKGRLYGPSATDLPFEGMTYNLGSNYNALYSGSAVFKKSTSYQVDVPAAVTMTVTTANASKYYVSEAADGTDNETSFEGASDFSLTAGTWYINVAGSNLNVTNIAFSAPKCAEPVIDAQPASKLDFPAGDMTASVTAHATDGGTLSYQWYNASDDSEVAGANAATLTTTTEGTYYVIVTNSLAGHADNSIKSDEATLGYIDLTDATLSALSYGGNAITLSAGVYEYDVNLPEGTTDVPVLAATATMAAHGATAVPSDAAAFVSYEATSTVLVTAADGTTTQTYTVNFHVAHAIASLVDVTDDMTWDFSKTGLSDGDAVGTDVIMANVAGVVNDANFKSDNIKVTANKQAGTKLQASMIMFHSTVDGVIKVVFSNTGNKSSERYLVVNGVKTDSGSKDKNAVTYYGFVPAGDVVLTVVEGDGNMFNFTSVKFIKKAAADLARDAAHGDDWMKAGELGTVCVPNGAVVVGGDMYTLKGKNDANKIVFETVPNNHMEPGVPYLFQSNGDAMYFYFTDEDVVSDPDNSGAMKGTFSAISLTELDNVYYFAGHALWDCSDLTSLTVAANRAYVKMDEVGSASPSPAPGRRYITMDVQGKNTTTGIGELNASEAPVKMIIDGKMFILRGEKLYDATGRLVK